MPLIELDRVELPYEMNEELKLFRTNLQFCGDDKQVILFTSAFSGEGKSTITLDLCRSLTELDKKVLLIATGALMSTTMNNQKLSIPSISHLVCLERVL